ncbi:MAG: Uma2 family endonuclease [Cyanobacteria bacterium J06639_1]
MTATQRLTFTDYLNLGDFDDRRYELIDGRLVELPPESGSNDFLANWLQFQLASAGYPLDLIRTHSCEVQVPVLQARDAANRYPDFVVLRSEHRALTRKRLTITLDMPPPRLVAEIVSPGKRSRDRDYVRKRDQYAACGISEYWIVDPGSEAIAIFKLDKGAYREVVTLKGDTAIASPELEVMEITLKLTVADMFAAIA